MLKRAAAALAFGVALATSAAAQPVSFQGKTVTMVIGYAPGGGTDAAGRVIAQFIGKYLPGSPAIVVRNVPGADGLTALNLFVQQATQDALTITMGSSTMSDPIHYRKPQAHFDPTKFGIIGGAGRGGTTLIINREAEKRLYDKAQKPVIMGSLGGVPRSGMQTTAWGVAFLGWNAKWVVGYPGTNDIVAALERGEIDKTSTANLFQIKKLLDGGQVKFLMQTGSLENGKLVGRPDFGSAPVFPEVMKDRITDPVAKQAFAYWSSLTQIDKWVALPPNAPPAMLQAYREAYQKVSADKEFLELSRRISEDFAPMSAQDVETLLNTLGSTSPEAIEYISAMLRKQGLEVD